MRRASSNPVNDRASVNAIVCAIRQRIAQGVWPRGSRLPTRAELAQLFATSPSTVQLAIQALTTDGTVVTRKRAGTCIATSAPECGRFAVVMSDHGPQPVPGSELFHDMLLHAAARIGDRRPDWRVEGWAADDPALNALVRTGALQGILYIGVPAKMPSVAGTGIPLACFHYPGAPWYGEVNITNRKLDFVETCVLKLGEVGHARIALLETDGYASPTSLGTSFADYFHEHARVIATHGGECPTDWILCVEPKQAIAVYQAVRLLLRHPQDRPNGIILIDDHLLPPVLQAIRDLGLRIPDHISVCVLGYSGRNTASDGCLRVGLDLDKLLEHVLGQLDLHRQGTAVARELPCTYTAF